MIISDTHFGLDSSTLKDQKMVDMLFWEIENYSQDFDEVVLLGDIFDFWRSRPEIAVRDSGYFLKTLSESGARVRYIVGNHDHHLVVQKQDCDTMERMARGDLYPVYLPRIQWDQFINGIKMEMYYPTLKMKYLGRTVLFTHGHHLSQFQAVSMEVVEKLRRLSGEEILPSDLETMMTHAFEGFYRSAGISEMVNFEEMLWNASLILKKFKSGIFGNSRDTPIERQYDAILNFIRERNLGPVSCFLYGDTHRPGIYQRSGGPVAINAGSFTHENKEGSLVQTPDTYLLLDETSVVLRQLGRSVPLYRYEFI